MQKLFRCQSTGISNTKTTMKNCAAAYLLAIAKVKTQKQIWKNTGLFMHIHSMSYQET